METDIRLPFKTSFTNPENTGLIRMVSESSQEHASDVKNVHHYLIEQVQQRHNALLAREKRSLGNRIQSIEQSIELLKNGQDTGQARRLIIILAALLGLMGGIFVAFIAEFIGAVRSELGTDTEENS